MEWIWDKWAGFKKKSAHGSHRRWKFQKGVTPVFSCCEEVQEGEEQDQPASGAILVLLKNTWSSFRRRKGGVRQKKTEARSASADMQTVNVTNSFWKFGHQCQKKEKMSVGYAGEPWCTEAGGEEPRGGTDWKCSWEQKNTHLKCWYSSNFNL